MFVDSLADFNLRDDVYCNFRFYVRMISTCYFNTKISN